MAHLSVREVDGAKIIKELTGRDAPVLVDPTLLLTKKKWLNISKEPVNKSKEQYLLTYFLGGIPGVIEKQIKGISKKKKLKVINLGDKKNKDMYRTGPSEFINYINNCSLFYTDSFHGAIFSIIFEKPFVVCERNNAYSMYSRINTLLNKFNLNSRKAENIKSTEDVFSVDFSNIPKILEYERNIALQYLNDVLHSEKKDNT